LKVAAFSSPLVVVGGAIAASWFFGLQAQGVSTVGLIPQGFPALTMPDLTLIAQLAPELEQRDAEATKMSAFNLSEGRMAGGTRTLAYRTAAQSGVGRPVLSLHGASVAVAADTPPCQRDAACKLLG
jgi:hypothetical protein